MKIVSLLFTCLMCVNLITAQQNVTHFKHLVEQSQKMSFEQIDSISCEMDKTANLAKLLTKENWKVSDLEMVDCLMHKASKNSSDSLKGVYYYLGGKAYSKFSDDIHEGLFKKAYSHFENSNDTEGMFYCLKELFHLNIKVADPNDGLSKKKLSDLFAEINQIEQKTDYLPVKLAVYECKLKQKLRFQEPISEPTLDSISDFANQYSKQYPNTSRKLLSVLGSAYHQTGNTEQAIDIQYKAIALANPNQEDYPTYFTNIAGLYYNEKVLDSAKYYFEKSFGLIAEEPKSAYSLESKSKVAYHLGMVYEDLNDMENAFYFMQQSLLTKNKLQDIQLEINKIYAEKKFEIQQRELQLTKKNIELVNKKRTQTYLITAIVFGVLLIGILLFLYYKTKQLELKAATLAKNRERLLQIISHDLISPLQVYATTATLLPKLMAKKKFAEIEKMQESLSLTSIAFQNTLNNLFAWSDKMKSGSKREATQERNVSQEIEEIVATYSDLASNRQMVIQTQLTQNLMATTRIMKFGNLVRNLIYNAVKHGSTGSIINVRLKEVDQKCFRICCENSISLEKLDNTQELVRLLNSKKQADYTGKGLGMELIFDAIASLNGTIVAELQGQELNVCCKLPK